MTDTATTDTDLGRQVYGAIEEHISLPDFWAPGIQYMISDVIALVRAEVDRELVARYRPAIDRVYQAIGNEYVWDDGKWFRQKASAARHELAESVRALAALKGETT